MQWFPFSEVGVVSQLLDHFVVRRNDCCLGGNCK